MTNEQINIAIAEACGWIIIKACDGSLIGKPKNEQGPMDEIPDYCNDLNAMHEAEKTLDFEQAELFEGELCDVTFKNNDGSENPLPCKFSVCHATAHQRAEAFLKTINKWEGGSDE
jgi:hypothetical protein